MTHQLLRAATSLGANFEEAKSATSRKDLVAKYYICLREAREAHYWLRLLHTTGDLSPARAADFEREASEFIAILTASIRRLKQPPAPSSDT